MSSSSCKVNPEDWAAFTGRTQPEPPKMGAAFRGKRVLITGAGGSIGAALARSIMDQPLEELVLLDQSELGLYELGCQFQSLKRPPRLVLGSVCDPVLLKDVFRELRPHVVFHAAAWKHVPLLESNPFAAASANVLGTQVVFEAARRSSVEQCILLSTDKAVAPTSIMGATKRIAELIFLPAQTEVLMKVVRLGNVLGSSGSVVPRFLAQIKEGGPVTLTHADATRYFLSPCEAVCALLTAASPDTPAGLLVTTFGQQVRVLDLARFLIEREAQGPVRPEIQTSGLRPGDKLAESMVGPNESVESSTGAGQLRSIRTAVPSNSELPMCLARIKQAVRDRDLALLLRAIHRVVPEYSPSALLLSQADASLEVSAT